MRIMTYNILDGGVRPSASRLELLVELMRLQRPDVLAIQEALWFDENGLLERVGKELDLPYQALSRGAPYEGGLRYNVATLSRFPILEAHTFPDGVFESASLSTLIDTDEFGAISFCNCHLHASSEDARLLELEQVLAHQEQFSDQILLGDFNSISSIDSYDPDTGPVELRADVTDCLRTRYVDVLGACLPKNSSTFPTSVTVDPSQDGSIRRIDYVYASEKLAKNVRDAQVIKSSLAERGSDHYPLIVDF